MGSRPIAVTFPFVFASIPLALILNSTARFFSASSTASRSASSKSLASVEYDRDHVRRLVEAFLAREFWTPIKQPPLDREILYPGPFARFSATPIQIRCAAPGLEDLPSEVFAEKTETLQKETVATQNRDLPLTGLKVLDFTWVYAGPAMTRQLADCGATVIKIESTLAPDGLRSVGPFKDSQAGTERSGNFGNVNLGKRSLALNLKLPEARALALRLVDWADVVVENFSPRAMKGWETQRSTRSSGSRA